MFISHQFLQLHQGTPALGGAFLGSLQPHPACSVAFPGVPLVWTPGVAGDDLKPTRVEFPLEEMMSGFFKNQ
jgi:hypothetical protein